MNHDLDVIQDSPLFSMDLYTGSKFHVGHPLEPPRVFFAAINLMNHSFHPEARFALFFFHWIFSKIDRISTVIQNDPLENSTVISKVIFGHSQYHGRPLEFIVSATAIENQLKKKKKKLEEKSNTFLLASFGK
jgi:hypothetical protein